ncbi:MAG: PAS domain S-box protein [Spirochaetota bacterium]|nr:PAS domain S-box protein [Spirochaetota bacterium]
MCNNNLKTINVLLIKGNGKASEIIKDMLIKQQDIHFNIEYYSSFISETEIILLNNIDVVLLDLSIINIQGDIIKKINARLPLLPIITFGNDDVYSKIKSTHNMISDNLTIDDIHSRLAIHSIRYNIKISKIKKELEESDDRFLKLSDSIQDGIIIINDEGNITYWNPAATKIFGYTKEEVIGEDLHILLAHNRFHNDYIKGFNVFKNTGKGYAIAKILELSAIRKDQTEFPIELSVSAVLLNDRWNAIGIVRDITERKRIEESLKNSEKRFRSLIEDGTDVIAIVNKDGYITYESPTAKQVMGYNPEDLINTHFLNRIHPDDKRDAIKAYEEILLNPKKPIKIEFRSKHKDGSWRIIELICKNLLDDPAVSGIVANFRDITERRQIEAIKSAKDAAESANMAKTKFLANISHELKTPLNSIIGFSQFLRMQQIGKLNETQLDYVNTIHNNGKHLLEIMNDILDISIIESQKIQLCITPCDIKYIVLKSVTSMESLLNEKGVKLMLNIEPNIGKVEVDETRLKQILLNLLSNAIKFTDSGKNIGIGVHKIEDGIKITVWDEGKGISKDNLNIIFDPFVQIYTKEEGKTGGTGLGLSIVKELVELHEGRLDVESIVGSGSRFSIILPKKRNIHI